MIRCLNHIQIMLDDQNSITIFGQAVQNVNKLMHICNMQTRRRFIQNIECTAGAPSRELRCQLDTLRFTTGQLRGRLSKTYIPKADLRKRLELIAYLRNILEKLKCLIHCHRQHIRNILTFIFDLQSFAVN